MVQGRLLRVLCFYILRMALIHKKDFRPTGMAYGKALRRNFSRYTDVIFSIRLKGIYLV